MKKLLLSLLLVSVLVSAACAEYVSGYTRSNGTYVGGYTRSDANSTVQDNFSYKGNINPSTGDTGTNYYRHSPSSAYYIGN